MFTSWRQRIIAICIGTIVCSLWGLHVWGWILVGSFVTVLFLMWQASSPRQVEATGIMARFERDIQSWPADQGIAAMDFLKAVLSGSGESQIDALAGQLTVAQFKRTVAVLREIETEADKAAADNFRHSK